MEKGHMFPKVLVDFFEANVDIAKGYIRSAQSRQYWNDFKSKLKKKSSRYFPSFVSDWCGPPHMSQLTEKDLRLLQILGQNYGAGLAGVAVDPFLNQTDSFHKKYFFGTATEFALVMLEAYNMNIANLELEVIPAAPATSTTTTSDFDNTQFQRRPMTAMDQAQKILANVESERVQAELRNAESFASLASSVSTLTNELRHFMQIEERRVAATERIAEALSSGINLLSQHLSLREVQPAQPRDDSSTRHILPDPPS
ncbi:hypothetical protein EVAR_85186_1 [Eumeta japonica]|uniref:Uncharacterized protein n=1 Tax=Eumeta variegata TaxID=151549 RepID=A0A4C1W0F0_EUMVA|nr:hypothetical protein EVAR_85186_1 [Eumeta japonica]